MLLGDRCLEDPHRGGGRIRLQVYEERVEEQVVRGSGYTKLVLNVVGKRVRKRWCAKIDSRI